LTGDVGKRSSDGLVKLAKFDCCSYLTASSFGFPSNSSKDSFLSYCGDDKSFDCSTGSFGDGVISVLFV
jgi:hypothetical protein